MMRSIGFIVAFGTPAAVVLIASAAATSRPASAPAGKPALPPAPRGVRIEQDVAYLESGREEKLDLYLPTDTPSGHCPAVVIIHGGGWAGGDKAAGREFNIASTLAQSGYVCASVNYMMKAGKRWPTNVQDCRNAVRFLRASADRYGVDPAHIGVIGGSAGGHLALMVAYTTGVPELSPQQPYPGVSDKVDAVVDFYGITDLLTRRKTDSNGNPLAETHTTSALLDVSATENPQAWRRASPVYYVSAKSPPTLIAHGTKDTTVDRDQAASLARKLEQAGAEYKLILLPGIGHTFDLDKWHGKPLPMDLRAAVIGFFDQHLKPARAENK